MTTLLDLKRLGLIGLAVLGHLGGCRTLGEGLELENTACTANGQCAAGLRCQSTMSLIENCE